MPKLDLFGTRRLDLLVVEEVVAALGFAGEGQLDRDVFSKFPRQFKKVADVATLEFQFDFADGSGSAPRTDLPCIERDLRLARTLAGQYPPALQERQFLWRNLEPQFDLFAHHSLLICIPTRYKTHECIVSG